MLRKFMFGALAATTALAVLPAAADAQGYYRDGYYGRDHYRGYYPRHRSHTSIYVGYGPAYYGPSYYRGYYPTYYRGGYYDRGYYDRGYYDGGYYGRGYYGRGFDCDNGTTGAIV